MRGLNSPQTVADTDPAFDDHKSKRRLTARSYGQYQRVDSDHYDFFYNLHSNSTNATVMQEFLPQQNAAELVTRGEKRYG